MSQIVNYYLGQVRWEFFRHSVDLGCVGSYNRIARYLCGS